MGDGGVVFETPLGKQLHNVNNWSEIFTALRDSLKEGADTSNNAQWVTFEYLAGATRPS